MHGRAIHLCIVCACVVVVVVYFDLLPSTLRLSTRGTAVENAAARVKVGRASSDDGEASERKDAAEAVPNAVVVPAFFENVATVLAVAAVVLCVSRLLPLPCSRFAIACCELRKLECKKRRLIAANTHATIRVEGASGER